MTIFDELFQAEAKGQPYNFPLVRLDKFKLGSIKICEDGLNYSGPGIANEVHVDDYLRKFVALIAPLISHFGVDDAMNLVLTARNSDKERSRLNAAEYLNSLIPYYNKILPQLTNEGYIYKIDAREPTAIWIAEPSKDGGWHHHCERTICKQVHGYKWLDILLGIDVENEKIVFGCGDGYHMNMIHGSPEISINDIKSLRNIIDDVRNNLEEEESCE